MGSEHPGAREHGWEWKHCCLGHCSPTLNAGLSNEGYGTWSVNAMNVGVDIWAIGEGVHPEVCKEPSELRL